MQLFKQCIWVLLVPVLCGSCALHSTANEWNGLVDKSGKPVHLDSTTKVGFNFLIVLPFAGRTNLDGMVNDATKNIKKLGGNYVRVIQGNSENYWYGFPPFTWIITPVVSTLVVEYQPTEEALEEEREKENTKEEQQQEIQDSNEAYP